MTGIHMSVMTKSGSKAFAFSMASNPFVASPHTSKPAASNSRTYSPPQSVMVLHKQNPARHMDSFALTGTKLGGTIQKSRVDCFAPTVETLMWAGT